VLREICGMWQALYSKRFGADFDLDSDFLMAFLLCHRNDFQALGSESTHKGSSALSFRSLVVDEERMRSGRASIL